MIYKCGGTVRTNEGEHMIPASRLPHVEQVPTTSPITKLETQIQVIKFLPLRLHLTSLLLVIQQDTIGCYFLHLRKP